MIKTLRGVAVVLLVVLFGLGALFLRFCIFPFQKSRAQSYKTLRRAWQFFIWILKKTKIIELKTDDIEKIKNIKNSVIVSTHPCFIDIVILMSLIPDSTCFVKEKLGRNPFFKGIVNLLFILEVKDTEIWLENAQAKINDGLNIIIFPMGRRHKKNETPKIRRGAALIAQKTGKNIEILRLEESFDFLQINQPVYDAGDRPCVFTLKYIGSVNTKEYLNKYKDEVTFKTEVTRKISKALYNFEEISKNTDL